MSQKEFLKQKINELIDNQIPDEPFGAYAPKSLGIWVDFIDKSRKELHAHINLV